MLARNHTQSRSLSLVLGVAAPALLALGACADQPTAPAGRSDLVPAVARSEPTVTVTNIVDLGTLGGAWSSAYDVNERGWVVGESTLLGTGEHHAFLWRPNRGMVDLGTLGGLYSQAQDINDRGQVVGIATTASNEYRAFLWEEKTGMTDLGPPLGRSYWDFGRLAITRDGQVVFNRAPDGVVVLWEDGVASSLGSLGSITLFGFGGLNDLGEIVGTGRLSQQTLELTPLFYRPGAGSIEFGTVGGGGGRAYAINNRSVVVGVDFTPGVPSFPGQAFIWREGTGMTLLAQPDGTRPPSSEARDVNDDGLVVGRVFTSGYALPFAWLPATGFVDLGTLPGGGDLANPSGYAGASAYAVNDRGDVGGASGTASRTPHATLWEVKVRSPGPPR